MLVRTVLDPEQRSIEVSAWFKELGVVLPSDCMISVFDAMLHTQQSRSYVLTDTGIPIGVISIENICRELIAQEKKQSSVNYSEMLKNNKNFYRSEK